MRGAGNGRAVVGALALAAVAVGAACRQGPSEVTGEVPIPLFVDAGRAVARDAGPAGPTGFIGVVIPRESVEVTAGVAGVVEKVHVDLGQKVVKGQVVATLDKRSIREELRVAASVLQSARAARQRADVDRQESLRNLDIERKSFESGAVAKTTVDDAESAAQRAGAALQGAAAQVEEARARLALLQRRLKDTEIVSPISGTVALRYLDSGAVSADQPIVRVIGAEEPWVRFALPKDAALAHGVGRTVHAHLDSLSVELEAEVRHVAPEVDSASQMIFAEAELKIPPALAGKVQPGMVARVTGAR